MMNKHHKLHHNDLHEEVGHYLETEINEVQRPSDCHDVSVATELFDYGCTAINNSSSITEERIEDEPNDIPIYNNIISYGNEISSNFFHHNKRSIGGGATYLITRAITETPVLVSEMLDPHEVCYHMTIGKFVNNLTKSQREEFAHIISQTSQLATLARSASQQYLAPSLPTSPLFIDNVYVRGKFSLLENLPHPTIKVIHNHGYVSLLDCVAHLLSFYDGFTSTLAAASQAPASITNITDSTAVRAIRERASLITGQQNVIALYCTEWSDDFDPALSTKANRQSCWVKTVTIMSCNKNDKVDKMCTTFPIAVGKKGQSHEAVELQFAEELKMLRSGKCSMYSKSTSSVVPVYMELLVSLQDQPERRSMNYLMLGSGKYSARWGFSCNIAEVSKNISTCSTCLDNIIMHGQHDYDEQPYCSHCTNWETCSDHPLLLTTPPNKYPITTESDGNYLAPFKLTYELLQNAVTKAHTSITASAWTIEEAKQYLRVYGINNDAIIQIIEHAQNEKIFNYAEMSRDTMTREYSILKHHKDQFPKKYVKWAYPAAWTRGIMLEQHVDVPMHLLFLGITKTTVKRIMEWTKQKNKHNNFLRMSTGVLESVKNLHIDWCVAIPTNGVKFGGWVSENYLALAILARWYFSMLPHLRAGPEYRDPMRPYTTWSVKELRDWLRVRGISCKGKKSELMEKVSHLLSQENVPEVLPPRGGSTEDVMMLTNAMGVAIGTIMQRSVTSETIIQTRYYIKRFLSSYHEVDKKLIKDGEKPGWLSSYNFMCLLNIPDLMKYYGPISNLWEGGYDGEKYSQQLKQRLKGGLKENWHRNLLKNVLANDAMKRIELPLQAPEKHQNDRNAKEKCYKNYNNIDNFIHDYEKRTALSVVVLNDGQWGAMVSSQNEIKKIQFEAYNGCVNGMHYWTITNISNNESEELVTIHEEDIIHNCILLPQLTAHGLPKRNSEPIYCAIESKWMDVVPDINKKPIIQCPSM